MDRNTVIGLVLIGIMLVVWSIVNKPSAEQLAHQKHIQDSTLNAQKKADTLSKKTVALNQSIPDSIRANDSGTYNYHTTVISPVSLFSDSTTANASEEFLTLENDLLKVQLSNKGGKIYSVELKKYKTHDGKPLLLFDEEKSDFSYGFFSGQEEVKTSDIFFKTESTSVAVAGKDSASISYRAYISPEKYIEQVYSVRGGSYQVGYKMNLVGLDSVIARNTEFITLAWKQKLLNAERSGDNTRTYSSLFYKFPDEDASGISSDAKEKFSTNVEWISFTQHFFNSTLIAPKILEEGSASVTVDTGNVYVKTMSTELVLPYKHGIANNYAMSFYFGPNQFNDLKKLDIGLEKIIPLGAGIFSWFAVPINRWLILPLFHFLGGFMSNYGIIILIMTIIIRVVTLPFTYKSMVSASKMKVLKPEIDELKEKYKDDQGRFGQEQLKLFKQAGVNPLGGCLPLLLQLPFLVAMYSLFPISIELRQQSFLWATDLTSYDSIYNFPNGFSLPLYGDHVSLFTLLMTATQIIMAVYTSQMNNVSGQMKWMQYVFPVMLLGIFNNLSAALTYYYFLFNILSIIMQWYVTNYMIDNDAIHRQIQENKKKPAKKGGFMARLEEMQKKQQQAARNRK